uniref:Ankyrin repeat and LEM domain-containing protein n=1 Tax=Anoplophora glabripennis TaxID=217634 RepID=V5G9M2_ANOGL
MSYFSEYNGSIKSSSFSSKMSSLPDTIDYDTDTLRKELIIRGYNPGPITVTTKSVYLKKLHQLKKYPALVSREPRPVSKRVYSVELEKTLRDSSWCNDLALYKSLEEVVAKQFCNPDPSRKWREGINKSSFTYLLLDPRLTNNLPGRAESLKPKEVWETFLSSVFYVGKGKRSRPYSHLYEAVNFWNKRQFSSGNKKIQSIIDIWRSNGGVICLHVFQNIIPVEAYTREAAMISALKIENLTNAKCGDYYGIAAAWPQKQKKMFGVYLLYKAMMIFLNEGERQLCPSDID